MCQLKLTQQDCGLLVGMEIMQFQNSTLSVITAFNPIGPLAVYALSEQKTKDWS